MDLPGSRGVRLERFVDSEFPSRLCQRIVARKQSPKVDFTQRCSGGLRVEAVLSESQKLQMMQEPKGDVSVAVTATDENGENPISCEMIWAWIPKKRDEEPTSN